MARQLNAGDISFGSDASIDGFALRTVLAWVVPGALNAGDLVQVLGKDQVASTWVLRIGRAAAVEVNSHLRFQHDFDGLNDGDWDTNDESVTLNAHAQVGVKFDRGSNANDPTFYINRTAIVANELLPPLGNSVSDAADNLVAGGHGARDLIVGFLLMDNALLSDLQVRRHYWWGLAGGGGLGGAEVIQPLWTADVQNKGTAVADGTLNGTTLAPLPRVERCHGAMLGVGR